MKKSSLDNLLFIAIGVMIGYIVGKLSLPPYTVKEWKTGYNKAIKREQLKLKIAQLEYTENIRVTYYDSN